MCVNLFLLMPVLSSMDGNILTPVISLKIKSSFSEPILYFVATKAASACQQFKSGHHTHYCLIVAVFYSVRLLVELFLAIPP